MKENKMPEFSGVAESDDVVDIDKYSRTTKSSHKKLQVWFDPSAPVAAFVAVRSGCESAQ
jgi:hypothetical protein